MNATELAEKVLESAKIPQCCRRFLSRARDYAVVEINGDYCSAKIVVLLRPDNLVYLQVQGAGRLVKVYAPVSLLSDEVLFNDIMDAVEAVKDWEPVQIDWSILADELGDGAALELDAAH